MTRLNPSRAVSRRHTPPPRRSPRLTTAHFLGFDDILGAIWEGIKWVAEKAAIIAVAVAQAVARAAVWAWDGMKWLGREAAKGAMWLKDRVVDFGKWWKNTAGPWLQKTFGQIHDWLTKTFGWLIKWVKWVQKNLGWVYQHILRPLLNAIDIVRVVLRLLADLGIKWAGELERWLAGVELKILTLWGEVLAFVNEIASIVDLIFNPNGFFQRSIFLWSHFYFARDIQTLFRLTHLDHDPIPEAQALMAGRPGLDDKSQAQVLVAELQTPPVEILDARLELERELALG